MERIVNSFPGIGMNIYICRKVHSSASFLIFIYILKLN